MMIPEVMRKWLSTALICFAMIFSHMAHATAPSNVVSATKTSQTVTHASHQHAGEKPAVGDKHSSGPADSNCASQCPAFVSAAVDLLSDRWRGPPSWRRWIYRCQVVSYRSARDLQNPDLTAHRITPVSRRCRSSRGGLAHEDPRPLLASLAGIRRT